MAGLHGLDVAVLVLYFGVVLYVGIVRGGQRTKTLCDYFVAGSRWGPIASFLFIFASAVAGNEAVVVAKGGYEGGLSGVWYWWSFLFATPVYYLFSTWFRRARVYNLAEFLEMRYGGRIAASYALFAGGLCILFIGMFVLAIGKILGGMLTFHADLDTNVQICVWLIAGVVAAYVGVGGMMSALVTDVLQGLMCLLILGFLGLPFLWNAAGGFDALLSLPASTWDMTSDGMTVTTVLALNLAAVAGGVAAPWIFSWISVSRDERAATQCGWGHLWKRVITLVFAIYGILFSVHNLQVLSQSHPDLAARITADPELAWGITMSVILPPVVLGLLIASFFAAGMSSADSFATTSSGLLADYLYRKVVRRGQSSRHYLGAARGVAVVSIFVAAWSTSFVDSIEAYIKLAFNLLCLLGVPIYAAVLWRRANRTGTWLALGGSSCAYVSIVATVMHREELGFVAAIGPAFEPAVFWATGVAVVGTVAGGLLGPREDAVLLQRFHVILSTPVGQEARLVDAGIRLPALVDAGLVEDGPEQLDHTELARLDAIDAGDKLLGPASALELRRESALPWYWRGFWRITLACVALIVAVAVGAEVFVAVHY